MVLRTRYQIFIQFISISFIPETMEMEIEMDLEMTNNQALRRHPSSRSDLISQLSWHVGPDRLERSKGQALE